MILRRHDIFQWGNSTDFFMGFAFMFLIGPRPSKCRASIFLCLFYGTMVKKITWKVFLTSYRRYKSYTYLTCDLDMFILIFSKVVWVICFFHILCSKNFNKHDNFQQERRLKPLLQITYHYSWISIFKV